MLCQGCHKYSIVIYHKCCVLSLLTRVKVQVRCLLMTLGTPASECVNNVTDVVQTALCQVIRENSSQLKRSAQIQVYI